MASLGDAGESMAVAVGAGELGSATATLLAGAGFTVAAVDRTSEARDELPEGIRQRCGRASLRRLARPHHTLPPPLHLIRS
jgi:phosphoglycerate dehydrogenase-like enzyme